MGWTVLYIAFGVVALWLLGEVLLQYKARLRWRLLAFSGFLGVVLGVLIPSVVVITIGAIAFAIGQTYVTLSFRRGFEAGWALRGRGRTDDRPDGRPRRGDADPTPAVPGPGLEVIPMPGEAGRPDGTADTGAQPAVDFAGNAGFHQGAELHQPVPPADATQPFDVYGGAAGAGAAGDYTAATSPYASYDPYGGGYGHQEQPVGQDGPGGPGGYDPYAGHQEGVPAGGYGYGEAPYPGYTDPYADPQAPQGPLPDAGQQSYEGYDPYGRQQYRPEAYQQDQYPGEQPYAAPPAEQQWETPPGGVWVPQQRGGEYQQDPAAPDQQHPHHPYSVGYDPENGGQYRY